MDFGCQMHTPADGLPCKHYIRPLVKGEPGFCSQPTRFRCEEAMKVRLPAISYSGASAFIACRRRWYHQQVEGLEVRPEHLPEPIKLGRAWDAYQHYLYDPSFDHLAAIQSLHLSPEQAAKLHALMRAHRDLEVHINKDTLLGCQYKIYTPVGTTNIVGYVDRAYDAYIVETKCSARPEFYAQKENVTFQLGTYFMANEAWESATVEIVRVPALQTGKGRYSEESPEQFEGRIYSDIIGRPAHYFIGWDRKTRTFGVKYWRTEFDLDEIFATFVQVLEEIKRAAHSGAYYRNHLACHVPAPCPYLPIKRTGVVSPEIFVKRQIERG